jgi:hypothetical protein
MRHATKRTRLRTQRVIVGTRTLTGSHEEPLSALATGGGVMNVVLSAETVLMGLSLAVVAVDTGIEEEGVGDEMLEELGRVTRVVNTKPTVLVVADSEGESMVMVSDAVFVSVRRPPASATVVVLGCADVLCTFRLELELLEVGLAFEPLASSSAPVRKAQSVQTLATCDWILAARELASR